MESYGEQENLHHSPYFCLITKKTPKNRGLGGLAPAAGFEPATKWLTATYSTAELCRNLKLFRKVRLK